MTEHTIHQDFCYNPNKELSLSLFYHSPGGRSITIQKLYNSGNANVFGEC
jgi:hypothetical protein